MFLTFCEELAFYLTTSCCCYAGIYFFSKKLTTRYDITRSFEETLNDLLSPPSEYSSWSLNKWTFHIDKYHDDYNKLRYDLEAKIYKALKKNKSPNYFCSDFIKKQLMFYIIDVLFDILDENGEIKENNYSPFELIELDEFICFFNYTDNIKKSLQIRSICFWNNFKKQKDGSELDFESTNKTYHKLFCKKLINLLLIVINKKIDFEEAINIILTKLDKIKAEKKNQEEVFLNLNNT